MKLPRGILKYGLYFFIGAWMFALGVVVGRGTSPVTFDTSSFQERLKVIVGKIPEQAPAAEKVDLDFYEALNKPVPQDTGLAAPPVKKEPPKGDATGAAAEPEADGIPVKFSRKRATYKGGADAPPEGGGKAETAKAEPPKASAKALEGKTAGAPKQVPENSSKSESGGPYTIQVAAYRAFKDAVNHMSLLEQKGFSSYRTKGETNGTTWYRVRTGSFKDYPAAQEELNRLKQAKLDGMIIKKEDQ